MASQADSTLQRKRIKVTGVVQGVGFRPTVYRLAKKYCISGFVKNVSGSVVLEGQGEKEQLTAFIKAIGRTKKPIQVHNLQEKEIPPKKEEDFLIVPSENSTDSTPTFPADLAVCQECVHELNNPHSRYYQYPFISCTQCGPRYSMITSLPYDRKNTTMAVFPLCKACEKEYHDPESRHFHAQTIACPDCGPQVELKEKGRTLPSSCWLSHAHQALNDDKILAVKGIGGFHLMCNGQRSQPIQKLRERKQRPKKPLALMVANIETARRYFSLSSEEIRLLTSPAAPIVLVKPKKKAHEELPLEDVAPGLYRIGIMLPYTPIHHLLFSHDVNVLVATSGNKSGLPTAKSNEDAKQQLQQVADAFLFHNRAIVTRVDDSVVQVVEEKQYPIRRSRGYVPAPIPIPRPSEKKSQKRENIIGLGADQKNTFCVLSGGGAWLSQHIGDIHTLEGFAAFTEGREHFNYLINQNEECQELAYDPHPSYLLTQESIKENSQKTVPVYHHHAHLASCMAEHYLTKPVIGCILDGTGYGQDGTLWGFEILSGNYHRTERMYSLKPIALPGGEKAIREPWLIGISLVYDACKDNPLLEQQLSGLFPQKSLDISIVIHMLKNYQTIKASSAGRLFDGIASILGFHENNSYEGEAALQLSEKMEKEPIKWSKVYPYSFLMKDDQLVITPMINELLTDMKNGVATSFIIARFHRMIGEMISLAVEKTKEKTGIKTVVLSGGVWQNRYLLQGVVSTLEKKGFEVYSHTVVPPGDGGIALGQVVSALWKEA